MKLDYFKNEFDNKTHGVFRLTPPRVGHDGQCLHCLAAGNGAIAAGPVQDCPVENQPAAP